VLYQALLLLLVTTVYCGPGGIYPDGHFDRVTKLTVSTFDDEVKENVDAGKTFFVRWIASEG